MSNVFTKMVEVILNLPSKKTEVPKISGHLSSGSVGTVVLTKTGLIHHSGHSPRTVAENEFLYDDVNKAWDQAQVDFDLGISLQDGLSKIAKAQVKDAYKASYSYARQWSEQDPVQA